MNNKVLLDENKQYSFDFSDLEYVWQMNDLTSNVMLILSQRLTKRYYL